ncbi:sigma-70 family RNA polymerase sigma factor (plasmid) [Paracoccus kondratievae]|uniref:RNA polymerase sigma factor n=1 Tax=Paracoccus kondratievae TaxID=135740 RepID=UPI0012664FD5|nr:RNA polymerase sigma factor [Paracoccus kondratievae]QFQ89588.1 sigma-70 family RNA polymerase sigma factor [Paracoccus kondratievae]
MTDSVHLACLYMKERPGLRRFLTRMTGSLGMADDLIQDTFLRVLEKEGGMGGVRDPRAYLRRSARNLAINALTAQRRNADITDMPETADPAPGAVERMIARQDLLLVMRTIAGLPEKRRQVFIMSRVDDLSYNQIAARLGISRNTVMVQIVRALSDLRKALEM